MLKLLKKQQKEIARIWIKQKKVGVVYGGLEPSTLGCAEKMPHWVFLILDITHGE